MNRKIFFPVLVIAGALAMLVIARGARPSDNDNEKARGSIVGSWKVTAVITEPPGSGTSQLFYTFAQGGTFLQTGNEGPRLGPGHGAWTRTGDHEFGLTFSRMRFDLTTDPPTYLGTLKIRWAPLRLNDAGDRWTSDRWVLDLFDPDGNFIRRAFEGTAQAERIVVEPLE